METSEKLMVGAGLAVVLGAAYYAYGGTTAAAGTDTGSGTNTLPGVTPRYATANTRAELASDGHRTWRNPEGDEWGSMCGSFSLAVPNACHAANMNSNTFLSWMKAMDIDPVYHQDYPKKYLSDIRTFYMTVPQKYWGDVVMGSGLAPGVTGRYAIGGCGCGIEGIKCLG